MTVPPADWAQPPWRGPSASVPSHPLAAQAQALYDIVERVRKLVGGNSGGAARENGTGRSPASLTPASSHSADSSALGRPLRQTGHAMAVAPHAKTGRSHDGDTFPLDDSDNF